MNLGIPSRESWNQSLWVPTDDCIHRCAQQKEIFHFCSPLHGKILLSPPISLLPLFNPSISLLPTLQWKFSLRTPMNSGCEIQWSSLSSSSNQQYTTQLTMFPPLRTIVTYPPENRSLGFAPNFLAIPQVSLLTPIFSLISFLDICLHLVPW